MRQENAFNSRAQKLGDSRTRRHRLLLDLVLPVGTLISTSLLTVVIIVLVVTTVAEAEFRVVGANDDWSRWASNARYNVWDGVATDAVSSPQVVAGDEPTGTESETPF